MSTQDQSPPYEPSPTSAGSGDLREPSQAVEVAEREYQAAATAYFDLSSRFEAALMSGTRTPELDAQYEEAGYTMADALRRLVRARKADAPTFEQLLADPTTQVDPEGVVLASVMAYSDPPLASACACGGSIHKGCKQ